MASRHDDQSISPEALRQLGSAIEVAAARTGARISGGDSALLSAIWSSLSPGERAALAESRDAGVQGKIEAIAERHAELAKQGQRTGPFHTVISEAAAGQSFTIESKRGPASNLWGQLADRASNEKGTGGSSAKYAEAGMAVPGNADARGFDIRNYYTSPVTRGLVDMGMRDTTFDYARKQVPGASVNNIRDAGRDAANLRFGVNDKEAVKDHTIIRKHDPAKADQVNKALKDYQDRLDNDPVLAELMGKRKKADTPEERKALDAQIQARRQEHRKGSGVKGYIDDKKNPEQSRGATGRRANEVDKLHDKTHELGAQHGSNPTDASVTKARQNAGGTPALQQRAEAAQASNTSPTDSASRFRAKADQSKAAPVSAASAPAPKN